MTSRPNSKLLLFNFTIILQYVTVHGQLAKNAPKTFAKHCIDINRQPATEPIWEMVPKYQPNLSLKCFRPPKNIFLNDTLITRKFSRGSRKCVNVVAQCLLTDENESDKKCFENNNATLFIAAGFSSDNRSKQLNK